ncbi:MAG: hypothetical protein ACTSRG_21450 [Candidatus Helarchaeota archaeon]
MKTRYKIALGCTLFNLILEYWIHGPPGFINPLLLISLFLLYSTYFLMVEDLILRYHLRDAQVFLIGFIFGAYTEIFSTGSVFGTGYFFGIDIFFFLIATVFWWGIPQAILTFYFANRYIEERDWDEDPMGKILWILAISYNVFMFLGSLSEVNAPPRDIFEFFANLNSQKRILQGYITSLVILGAVIIVYFIIQKIRMGEISDEIPYFKQSKFMDIYAVSTIIISLFFGTIFFGERVAQELFVYWSIFVGVIFIIYRLISKKDVSV